MCEINLDDIQGHILKGFNKPTVRFLFFRFGNDLRVTKEWLMNIAKKIPSTTTLLDVGKELHARKKADPSYNPQEIWLHVSLSRTGVKKLGLRIPPSRGMFSGKGKRTQVVSQEKQRHDPFEEGMKYREDILRNTYDRGLENWVEPFKSAFQGAEIHPEKWLNGTEIDVLLVVASDEEDDGDSYTLRLLEEATLKGIVCVGMQIGKAIENEQGKQVEHFGFRDGVSQPLISKIDDEDIEKRKVDKDKFDPEDFVLSKLTGDLEWANNGSFLVFRRLRQDVGGFWTFMNNNSDHLHMAPEELAAKIVGRWKSGAPLAKHPNDPVDPEYSDYNDFKYGNDPKAELTATFAHIKVANPKDDLPESVQHRILRRAIPYGVSWAKDRDPTADRGLLFLCFQRDLLLQFEYVQTHIYQRKNYPDLDPQKPHDQILNLLLKQADKIGLKQLGLEQWVTSTGGEYFFSPSISALKNLY